jgi:hypothetical protein
MPLGPRAQRVENLSTQEKNGGEGLGQQLTGWSEGGCGGLVCLLATAPEWTNPVKCEAQPTSLAGRVKQTRQRTLTKPPHNFPREVV